MKNEPARIEKRNRTICMSCVATLCILAVYTHCADPKNNPNRNDHYPKEAKRVSLRKTHDNPKPPARGGYGEGENGIQKTEYALVLGMDRSRDKMGRTDTIMIVALNYDENKIGFIGVPRDLWVHIPHLGPGRINKVYRVGERFFGEGMGRAMLEMVIEDVFEIEISHFAAVNFAGFKWTVDALKGIPVEVACPIEDCFWANEHAPTCKPFSLDAGRQTMNGETALFYARSRHGRNDLDRARRGQAILLGLWERITEFDGLAIPEIFFELRNHITTTVNITDVPRILELARSINVNALHGIVLRPPEITPSHHHDGKFIFVPDKNKISARLDNLFAAPLPGAPTRPRCVRRDAALNWRADIDESQFNSNPGGG